jgi:hypothetical protein
VSIVENSLASKRAPVSQSTKCSHQPRYVIVAAWSRAKPSTRSA